MPTPVAHIPPAQPLVGLGPTADNDADAGTPPAPCPTLADLERLIAGISGYLREEDVQRVRDAYAMSATAHAGQFRMSGEPYVSHPLAVAEILSGWHLDSQALCAAHARPSAAMARNLPSPCARAEKRRAWGGRVP